MSRAVRYVAVLLLCCSLGLHWQVLQSVAWASMLVVRLQSHSLRVALGTTFDGRHPCRLCEFIREGKAAEKLQPGAGIAPLNTVASELVYVRFESIPTLFGEGSRPATMALTTPPASRMEPPPLPPPRTV